MGFGQLGLARVQPLPCPPFVPGQAQVTQQRQACLQIADGMPRLPQGQIAVRYLEQAQGVRALGSLGPESFRRLQVGLDGRLGVAQTLVAIAEQVEEVGRLMRPSSGRPSGTLQTFLNRHGGPSGWADVAHIRPTVINLPTMPVLAPSARTGIR
jgi:hypothetical protein